MKKKKEYQTGTAPASQIEKGSLSNLLFERSNTGWELHSIKKYFSKEYNEDAFFWVLEREIIEGN